MVISIPAPETLQICLRLPGVLANGYNQDCRSTNGKNSLLNLLITGEKE